MSLRYCTLNRLNAGPQVLTSPSQAAAPRVNWLPTHRSQPNGFGIFRNKKVSETHQVISRNYGQFVPINSDRNRSVHNVEENSDRASASDMIKNSKLVRKRAIYDSDLLARPQ